MTRLSFAIAVGLCALFAPAGTPLSAQAIGQTPGADRATGPASSFVPPRPMTSQVMTHWPPYPPQAIRLGQQGIVRVRMMISVRGIPEDIAIAQSSTYPLLDAAAIEAVRRWRFVAATRDGKAVQAVAILPIRFALEAPKPPARVSAIHKPPRRLAKPGTAIKAKLRRRSPQPLDFLAPAPAPRSSTFQSRREWASDDLPANTGFRC